MRSTAFRLLPLRLLVAALLLSTQASMLPSQPARQSPAPRITELAIENSQLRLIVRTQGDRLISDRLETRQPWSTAPGGAATAIETDADFALDLMYTDWDAPGQANNADNLVTFSKELFSLQSYETHVSVDSTQELSLLFKGIGHPIRLMMTYRLSPKAFYVKKRIAVLDSTDSGHFLRFVWPCAGTLNGVAKVVKEGGFGQPVAVNTKTGGAFFGLEYPASENRLESRGKGEHVLRCGEEYGERIGKSWLESDWVVEAVTPDQYVKLWFNKYVNDIRVSPLRPYSLYNTWYDLRSPEYPRWSKENVMSEVTSLKMVDILRRNMIEKYNIKLDAFVLDDGWDVYKSDWVLRKEQWPNGLKPLADALQKTNTSLGVWIGPTGGYSFHNQRVTWMKDHGYEVVNDMMCVAGKNYSRLLRDRVADFVQNDNVGYFKWDGIQFSCSEPDHGHPVDVYSRRAVLKSVAAMCKAARDRNPNMFLNITSGTWMSPWWVQYANTIWMQGADYGFADVPSISMRDGAITYRDFVLYEDWKLKGLWFPISNLMTHGIIKGKHESVGIESEPLDKFTDDVLLYFARGVSMYELYISPDILSDGEWTSIAKSMAWARNNFDVLMNTELVGGNPMKGEPYGYVHFKGTRGIIAARNPVIGSTTLKIDLSVAQGLDPKASSLVLRRLYPTKWISPKLYKAGETLSLPLEGFETSVYELFPLADAAEPLVAGVLYDVTSVEHRTWKLALHNPSNEVRILNPSLLTSGPEALKQIAAELRVKKPVSLVTKTSVEGSAGGKGELKIELTLAEQTTESMVAVLLAQDNTTPAKVPLKVTAALDGKSVAVSTERQEGKSQWYTVPITSGSHKVMISAVPVKDSLTWHGKATAWVVSGQKQETKPLELTMREPAPQTVKPPVIWQAGELRKNVKIGEARLVSGRSVDQR